MSFKHNNQHADNTMYGSVHVCNHTAILYVMEPSLTVYAPVPDAQEDLWVVKKNTFINREKCYKNLISAYSNFVGLNYTC